MKQIWLQDDTPSPVLLDLPCGQAAVFSRRNPTAASSNEDGAMVIPWATRKPCWPSPTVVVA